MKAITAKMFYEMEKDHDMVLVTIVDGKGSTPRGAGSQMLVGAHGRIVGTIGGGAVEMQSEMMATALLSRRESQLYEFALHADAQGDIGMVCGGDVTVWFQFISGSSVAWRGLVSKIEECFAEGRYAWLVLRLDGQPPQLVGVGGAVLYDAASVDGEADNLVCAVPVEALQGEAVRDGDRFVLPVPLAQRAIIFGGGHIALALTPLLEMVGFRVTVFDDRPEYADPSRFPKAERTVCGPYTSLDALVRPEEEDYVVVITNAHANDFEVEKRVLQSSTAYVGVIGSKSKIQAVNQKLREAGVSDEVLAHVHTPIGTPIMAVTPEEIAVSIAGEMIRERALSRQ